MGLVQYIRLNIWSELPGKATLRQRVSAAVVWGLGLMLLGAWSAWRHHHLGEPAGMGPECLAAGGLLLGVLLLLPVVGPAVFLYLMRAIGIVGFIIGNLLLVLTFYLLVTPMGWLMRRWGKDFLEERPSLAPAWKDYRKRNERRRYYRLS
jgi:hypothetical protein